MAVSATWGAVAAREGAEPARAAIPAGSAGAVVARARLIARRVAARAEAFAVGVYILLAEAEIAEETVVRKVHFVGAR